MKLDFWDATVKYAEFFECVLYDIKFIWSSCALLVSSCIWGGKFSCCSSLVKPELWDTSFIFAEEYVVYALKLIWTSCFLVNHFKEAKSHVLQALCLNFEIQLSYLLSPLMCALFSIFFGLVVCILFLHSTLLWICSFFGCLVFASAFLSQPSKIGQTDG